MNNNKRAKISFSSSPENPEPVKPERRREGAATQVRGKQHPLGLIRPPCLKLNATTQQILCEMIAQGCTDEDAAAAAGITRVTLWKWKRDGAAAKEKEERGEKLRAYEIQVANFVDAVEVAIAELHNKLLGNIRAAGEEPKHWQANAWLLQNLKPFKANYPTTRTMRVEGGDPDKPVRIESGESLETKRQLLLRLIDQAIKEKKEAGDASDESES